MRRDGPPARPERQPQPPPPLSGGAAAVTAKHARLEEPMGCLHDGLRASRHGGRCAGLVSPENSASPRLDLLIWWFTIMAGPRPAPEGFLS